MIFPHPHVRLQAVRHGGHAAYRHLHEPMHLLYFLFVSVESHGAYGIMAGGCLLLGVIGYLTNTAEG